MRWKQHILGTIIAFVGAVLLLVLVNFAMPSQLVLSERVVIPESNQKVIPYISTPDSLALWFEDLNSVQFTQKPGTNRYQFTGQDEQLHELKILAEEKDGKVKMEYYQDEEKKAIFFFHVLSNGAESIVKVEQYWNIGWNPLAKLLAKGKEEEMTKKLKKDLIRLKEHLK